MKRRDRSLTFIILLGVGLLLYFWFRPTEPSPTQSTALAPRPSMTSSQEPATVASSRASDSKKAPPYTPIGRPATHPLAPLPLSDPAMRSPLADELLDPEHTSKTDLQIILNLCDHFFEKCGGMPVGTNREIVNALTGNNPLRLAFLPRSHPAISATGELQDRYGTPFFFHNIARDLISIRSAGPDRSMFTPDDQVEESPRLTAEGS